MIATIDGQAERDAQRVDERRQQHSDQNADHFQPLPRRIDGTPMLPSDNHRSIRPVNRRCRRAERPRQAADSARDAAAAGPREERQRRPRDRRRRARPRRAAVAVLRAPPPGRRDPSGEEGADHAGTGDAPLVDRRHRRHRRLRRAACRRLVQRRRARGRARARSASAVHDPLRRAATPPPAARARRSTASRSRRATRGRWTRRTSPTFLRQDRLVKPGVRDDRAPPARRGRPAPPRRPGLARAGLGRRRPARRAGSSPRPTRGTGSPARCSSKRPAASRRVVERETRWHVAGSSALVDELVALLT